MMIKDLFPIAVLCACAMFTVRICNMEKGVKWPYVISSLLGFITCVATLYIVHKYRYLLYPFFQIISDYERSFEDEFWPILTNVAILITFFIYYVLSISLSFFCIFRVSGKLFVKLGYITQEQYQRNFCKKNNHAIPTDTENDRR